MNSPQKILIIQTAFIGDVVLATSLIEKVMEDFPQAKISVVVRAGSESLLQHHPKLHHIYVWHKKNNKFFNLWALIKKIKKEKFDVVLNVQRYFSSGLLTILSNANLTIGFKNNPLSFKFSVAVDHAVPTLDKKSPQGYYHEVQRNFQLHAALCKVLSGEEKAMPESRQIKPKLYFGHDGLNQTINEKRSYVVIAPASVWFTKQWPIQKWIELVTKIPTDISIFLVGSKDDFSLCQKIAESVARPQVANTCGKLSLLQTALLMKNAKRVFCNDSAPSHLASAVNAPQTVIFCSTVVEFGFGPLSDDSKVVSVDALSCRPCGVHGHKNCPLGHFKCARDIDVNRVLETLI